MSAFHRIDDVRAMPGRRFINLALRLVAYKGILRALVEAEKYEEQQAGLPDSVRSRVGSGASQARTVESSAAALRNDPAFAGMIEVKESADA